MTTPAANHSLSTQSKAPGFDWDSTYVPASQPEFFATNGAVAILEAQLAAAPPSEQTDLTIALAWQLRQRDTQRALTLSEDAAERMSNDITPTGLDKRHAARLLLIRGEAQWLFGDFTQAHNQATKALHDFQAMGDPIGCADAHWLLSWIAADSGDLSGLKAHLATMASVAEAVDPVRSILANAAFARFVTFKDAALAKRDWLPQFPGPRDDWHPAVNCWVEDFLGIFAKQTNEGAQDIRHLSNAHGLALATGQITRAITAATNVGDSFNRLNEHQTALEWMQLALNLARQHGWPFSIGSVLTQTAGCLLQLQRYRAARDLLQEALLLMKPMAGSRFYAIALAYLGDVELGLKDYASAQSNFQLLEQRAISLSQEDLLIGARNGLARAHLGAGEPQYALTVVRAVLDAKQARGIDRIAALEVMANIQKAYPMPPPADMIAANPILHYLHCAVELGTTISGYIVPNSILETIAHEYAAIADYQQAYEFSLQAIAAKDKTQSKEATNRAIAMQVSHETERARAEGEQHRLMSQANAERADALARANATLEQLGNIGREITGNLDVQAIFAALYLHVHALLDATTVTVFRLDTDGRTLNRLFGMEAGHPLPALQIALDDPARPAARCAREQIEIVINDRPPDMVAFPGTLDTLSMMFAPLLVGERMLGVLSIQSLLPNAYGERELAIFRALCAYGAIALANADAQTQLVQSQKLASLGRLVNGVSHELNTPLGNSLIAVGYLRDELLRFKEATAATGLKRQAFDTFLGTVDSSMSIALRSLDRCVNLVNSFKKIAVDKTSRRDQFLLHAAFNNVLREFEPKLHRTGHQLTTTVAQDVQMDTFPAALMDVLKCLLDNALSHGLVGREKGHISLLCEQRPNGQLRIAVIDDGHGIQPEDATKVFDPFFTTRMGQGSGLGLHIAHNMVTQLLGGTLTVQSKPEEGCSFELVIPTVAP